MKRSRFSEEKIISIHREADGESTVKTMCAKHNFGGMDVDEARRLRALEDENGRRKPLVADLSVQNQILKEVNSKKW